jgi:23S rRNA pseudouridine1911/1915/1917 synthase
MAAEVLRHTVGPEVSGIRLDQFLASTWEGVSRTLARKLIELGGVHLDGRRVRRCGQILVAGQRIEVYRDNGPLEPFVLQEGHLLFRDPYLLAVNKPAGVETQPTPARYRGTLYAALLDFLHDPFRPLDRPTLGMVQRLDRDTSGVMVFSIHPRAHKGLTTSFSEHRVDKCYLALVNGRVSVDGGEFHSHLARCRSGNRVRSVDRGGKEALTRFRVLERFRHATLVEVELLTGRTHQIRAHFAEAGHPLLGDHGYGSLAGGPERQMLHALRLRLAHPVTGVPLILEAPVPQDMQNILDLLRAEDAKAIVPAPD